MWNRSYVDKIIERTAKRLIKLDKRMSEVRPGRQMPEETQVTIGSGRQMEIAVLFLDICNYSRLYNDSYEAQGNVLALMNIFMAEMMNIVRDHKGEFEKNTGDGLMAYFGTETTNPKECVQTAIEASLTMHYFNDNLLKPYLINQGSPMRIDFRIGIDYGKVTIARVGVPGGLSSFVAIGTSANIASKLIRIGHPGEIVIGGHVKIHLPVSWQKFCELVPQFTGFNYIVSGWPYLAYKYNGRWTRPS